MKQAQTLCKWLMCLTLLKSKGPIFTNYSHNIITMKALGLYLPLTEQRYIHYPLPLVVKISTFVQNLLAGKLTRMLCSPILSKIINIICHNH